MVSVLCSLLLSVLRCLIVVLFYVFSVVRLVCSVIGLVENVLLWFIVLLWCGLKCVIMFLWLLMVLIGSLLLISLLSVMRLGWRL